MMKSEELSEELSQAGTLSAVTPELLKLDTMRIMSDTPVPSEDFLMRMYGKPCFPRRDLSTITGMEKCGKTVFSMAIMACGVERRVLELERIREAPLKVMWYDTEQSQQSTKSNLTDRVYKLIDHKGVSTSGDSMPEADKALLDQHFLVFNVRPCTCQERLDYLIAGIKAYKPDMVIIDNVSDLLSSVNDAEQSVQLIDQLMQLASQYDCNITVVIHLNRSGEKRSLRGWLGTEILHKAFEVYYCEQIEKTDVFSIEQVFTRKYRVSEKIYYKITDEGLPVLTERPTYQPRDREGHYLSNKPEAYQVNGDTVSSFNQKYIVRHEANVRQPWEWNLGLLFSDAMAGAAQTAVATLKSKVMELSGIRQPKYYDKVFQLAVDRRVVQTTLDRNGRIVVISVSS